MKKIIQLSFVASLFLTSCHNPEQAVGNEKEEKKRPIYWFTSRMTPTVFILH